MYSLHFLAVLVTTVAVIHFSTSAPGRPQSNSVFWWQDVNKAKKEVSSTPATTTAANVPVSRRPLRSSRRKPKPVSVGTARPFPSFPSTKSPTRYVDLPQPLPKSMIKLVESNNRFGFKLCNALIKYSGKKNIFISPMSLFGTLVTVYAASSAETSEEMANVLELGHQREEDVQNGFRDILHNLMYENSKENTLKLLNAMFVDNSINVSSTFTDKVRTYYNGYLEKVGFASEPEYVVQWANQLVEWWTEGNIKKLLNNQLDPMTKLLLVNAIYFKGKWAEIFNPKHTTEYPFKNADGSVSKVKMMRLSSKFKTFCDNETLNTCAIELPYSGNHLSFVVLLPMKGGDLSTLNVILQPEAVNTLLNNLEERSLELGLPKFSLNANYNLHKPLEDMGMKSLFTPESANLSKIGSNKELFVKEAKHKTVIDVSEEGTVAAGASYVVIGNRVSPPRLYVDHPFVFIIRDLRTNVNLFLGRVSSL
ncbi:serpin B6-like protein [Leptotrombidium deliense]|uniref:Serpin B6-like protein n=1 Tax=Leptotrombidium deliense TaxID=299467 RepID=A0A443SW85_9ACAR|nr:serpin B6-like protein [Leptotrombidium deliense]